MPRSVGLALILVLVIVASATIPAEAHPAWPGGGARASAAAAALAAGTIVQGARPRLFGAMRIRGHERRGLVAFTFDDGPHRDTTPKILAALAAHDVPAAFFVCGYQIDGDSEFRRTNARLLDAEIAAGHLVGNHTYRHSRLATASRPFAWNAIAGNERLVAAHLGGPTRLFRPPYGRLSQVAERLLADLGYTIVKWSIESGDHRPRDPDELRDDVLRQILAAGGGVVLMHDTKTWTAKALPQILAGLERENCRRLSRGEAPILPVSLDYFATDANGQPLPVPAEVEAQTERTRAALEERCSRRRERRAAPSSGRVD